MKRPVTEYFEEGIINQQRFIGKSAADGAVMSSRHYVKQVAQLRDNLNEIAIHGQDVAPLRRRVSVGQRASHAIRRFPVDQFDAGFAPTDLASHRRGSVFTVVIDDNNLENIRSVIR